MPLVEERNSVSHRSADQRGGVHRYAAAGPPATRHAASLWILLTALVGLASIARPAERLVMTVADDASYYFQIALNAARGNGLSFDGVHPTNGFHPIWQALLIGLAWISHRPPEEYVRWVLVVQTLLMIGTAVLLRRVLFRDGRLVAGSFGLLGFLLLVFVPALNGMESALTWFALAALVARAPLTAAHARPSVARGIEVGAWLALLCLCRLDLVFHALAGIALLPFSLWWISGATLAALLAPYLLWNVATFGHLVPISGALKTSFPTPGFHLGAFQITRLDQLLLLLGCLTSACYLALWLSRRSRPGFDVRPTVDRQTQRGQALGSTREHDLLAIGALLHVAYCVLYVRWAAFGWYFVPEKLALVLLGPALLGPWIDRPLQRIGRALPVAVTALLLVGLGLLYRRDWSRPVDSSWHVASYRAAVWARTNLPAGAVLAMKDAGHFAFFSQRSVVNLDGLANNFEYQEALRADGFAPYLAASGVEYFVQHAFPEAPEVTSGQYAAYRFESYSHLYQRRGGAIEVTPADEVYRSAPYFDGPNRTVFVIFRVAAGTVLPHAQRADAS